MSDPLFELFGSVFDQEPASLSDASAPANTPAWDSAANIMLITEIEAQFNIELSTADIESMKSIGDARAVLRRLGVSVL